jgi:hypothetical protein
MKKLFLLTAFVLPAFAGYGYQATITLGNSSQIPASQTNFTVLVCANLTMGNGNSCPTVSGLAVTGSGGYVTNSSGYDIVFSTTACSSPTLMNWEIPTYTGSSGAMEAWVLVPSLAAGGSFYMCVGNSAITTFQGGAAGAEWNSSYLGVYHLPNGSTLSANDSTSHANTGTPSSAPAVAGQIDGGVNFAGTGYVDAAQIAPATSVTLSAWVKLNSTTQGTYSCIVMQDYASSATSPYIAYGLEATDNGSSTWVWQSNMGGTQHLIQKSGALDTNWHYIVGVSTSGSQILYFDGSVVASGSATGSLSYSTGHFRIGQNEWGNPLNGIVDEVRVANVPLSANWVTTEYNNQKAPASFLTVGGLTAVGSSSKRRIIVVN